MEIKKCCICHSSNGKIVRFSDGQLYCHRHYMQMYHHGHILNRTIYEPNDYVLYDDYAEIICYDKNGYEKGRIKIDLDMVDKLKPYKVYIRKQSEKYYAAITLNNRKVLLHRYIFHLENEEYSIRKVIDHINGDSFDNRRSNLRICSHKDNMKNIKKKFKVTGVSFIKNTQKWAARIMKDYKGYHLGYFNTYEEAVLNRLKAEKELFGDFGPNKNLFYVLDLSSPLEELNKVLKEEV